MKNRYIVMGITGSGKSTVGSALARSLGVEFLEGDDYHPVENVRKMSLGIPLTDDDRAAWLRALAHRISQARQPGLGLVVSCSALKRSYRDVLRGADPDLQFIFLNGSRSLIEQRLASRRGHFMPASLIDSQLEILEEPGPNENAIVCDIRESPQQIVDELVARVSA